jgi:hypothetical protein
MKRYYFVPLYDTSNSWQSKLIIFKHPKRFRFLNCDFSISCIFLNTFHYYHSLSTITWNAQYATQHSIDFQTVTAVFPALFLIRFMIMIYLHQLYESGPASSVGIATDYGLDGPGIESQKGQDFQRLSRPALGPTQPPVPWVPGLSRG